MAWSAGVGGLNGLNVPSTTGAVWHCRSCSRFVCGHHSLACSFTLVARISLVDNITPSSPHMGHGMAMTSISLLYPGDRGSGFRSAMGARGGTMRTHGCLYVFTVCTIACSLVLCCAHDVDPRPARIAAFLEWCVQGVGRASSVGYNFIGIDSSCLQGTAGWYRHGWTGDSAMGNTRGRWL